jgi:hypothetical protein
LETHGKCLLLIVATNGCRCSLTSFLTPLLLLFTLLCTSSLV